MLPTRLTHIQLRDRLGGRVESCQPTVDDHPPEQVTAHVHVAGQLSGEQPRDVRRADAALLRELGREARHKIDQEVRWRVGRSQRPDRRGCLRTS